MFRYDEIKRWTKDLIPALLLGPCMFRFMQTTATLLYMAAIDYSNSCTDTCDASLHQDPWHSLKPPRQCFRPEAMTGTQRHYVVSVFAAMHSSTSVCAAQDCGAITTALTMRPSRPT